MTNTNETIAATLRLISGHPPDAKPGGLRKKQHAEAEALLALGRHIAEHAYHQLRLNALKTYGLDTCEIRDGDYLSPAELWIPGDRSRTLNDLSIAAVVAAGRAYWDSGEGFHVLVDQRSGGDRRRGERSPADVARRKRDRED